MHPRRTEYAELSALFFLQAMASGIWMVPLSRVLAAHGYEGLRAAAFATNAIAAFVSPLLFGALADRHAAPSRVLRWLSGASAAAMAAAAWAMARHEHPGVVLGLIQLYALCAAPTGSIISAIVFSRLHDSPRQFGPLRALATLGWMAGCWLISALGADSSPLAGYTGALAWLGLAGATWFSPAIPPPASPGRLGWRERLGWDALGLLRDPDHRVVFITTALFSIPLAAFYPFTPGQLVQLGYQRTSAWMSLGQISELAAMFSLGWLLLRVRLKWIFAGGLLVALARYLLGATNHRAAVLLGVSLHGLSFTLFFITAQIYLNERIEPVWRARAQALLTLMLAGVGNLAGYLGAGAWLRACARPVGVDWTRYWGGLAVVIFAVAVYFVSAYHGQSSGLRPREHSPAIRAARPPVPSRWARASRRAAKAIRPSRLWGRSGWRSA